MTKKLNPKVAAVALLLLSFLAAGGIAIKEGVSPGEGGLDPTGGSNGTGGGG